MFFNIISSEDKFNIFHNSNGLITIYHTYDVAIKNTNANFLNEKINDTTYWTEDIDGFIKRYLKSLLNEYKIIPKITSDEIKFDFTIECDNELICLKNKEIYIFDKKVILYFNEDVKIINEKEEFELLIKSCGILDVTINDLIHVLTNMFGNEYKYYLPIIYSLCKKLPLKYKPDLFSHISFCKNYLEKIRIYNIDGEFKTKKDVNGKYIQSEYTEYITGRLGQKNNSLQTLSKEKRGIVKAEPECFLIDFDFKSFEYNIFLDLLSIPKTDDPHLNVLEELKISHLPRHVGKTINYSFLYGKTPEAIVKEIKNDYEANIELETLKSLPIAQKTLDIPINDNIIYTYFGRPIKINKEWARLNNYIQSTGADIFFMKLKNCIKLLDQIGNGKNKVLLQNHDSCLIQLEEEKIDNTIILNEIILELKKPIDIFTFEIDFNIGRNWGNMK